MTSKLYEARRKNPRINEEIVDSFARKMPNLLNMILEGMEYNCHIGSKDIATMAEQYITNNKNEHIGFKWDYDTLISAARNYVDFDTVDFYETDLWVWANVKYGDMQHITTDSSTIIKYAISELTDDDFPFYDSSQRAYCWLKKHVENDERDKV